MLDISTKGFPSTTCDSIWSMTELISSMIMKSMTVKFSSHDLIIQHSGHDIHGQVKINVGLLNIYMSNVARYFKDIVAEFCGPFRWKELSKETSSTFFPYLHRQGQVSPQVLRNTLIVGLDPRTKVCEMSICFAPTGGVGSKRQHIVPFGELNDVPVALVARLGGISKSTDRIRVSHSKKESHRPKPEQSSDAKLHTLHMDLCGPIRVESINGKRAYTDDVGINHEMSVARTPQQNGVVKRRNRTLVEATRTMLIFSKSLLFLWAEAVATALVPNKAVSTSAKPPSKNHWDLLFQPMFDGYFKPLLSDVSPTISVAPLLIPDTTGAYSSTTIDQDTPSLSTSPNNETTTTPINSLNFKQLLNEEDVEFDIHTFTNLFAPLETTFAKSSSRIFNTSNMHTFQQPQRNTKRWTKDHPLVTVISDPSKLVSTRRQLATNDTWYYFHAFLTKVKPKNYKEAMTESLWIEAMQEKIHEFKRLEVWELVPRPSNIMIIALNIKYLDYFFIEQQHFALTVFT
nr:hypothetical protein [Tanacetum cinerariifolium]